MIGRRSAEIKPFRRFPWKFRNALRIAKLNHAREKNSATEDAGRGRPADK